MGAEAFLEEYAGLLRTAYPRTFAGAVFPFPRVFFAVAHSRERCPRRCGRRFEVCTTSASGG
jgi:hypothetical protein